MMQQGIRLAAAASAAAAAHFLIGNVKLREQDCDKRLIYLDLSRLFAENKN